MTRSKVISLLLAVTSAPCALYMLKTGWRVTEFFHQELIHSHLMALGDGREPTFGERLHIGLVWLPWSGIALAIVAAYCLLVRRLMKSELSQTPIESVEKP
jgi:hypothetical protein